MLKLQEIVVTNLVLIGNVGIISVMTFLQLHSFLLLKDLCAHVHTFYIYLCVRVSICPFSDGLFIRAAPCALAQARGMHIFFVHEWRLARLCQSL